MKRYFCTLFDSNYLIKGLALYNSLRRVEKEFLLYILCMDELTYQVLKDMDLHRVNLIRLKEIEDNKLIEAKGNRTWAEYCFTCASVLLLYIIRNINRNELITYLDSDIYFFNTPEFIFEELSTKSILLIEHDFSDEFRSQIINGIYNVQFMAFRNNECGLDALQWWCNRVMNKCRSRLFGKANKGGDQIYLNALPKLFREVYILKNKKMCLGPWNLGKYNISVKEGVAYADDTPLVFYHFSGVKLLKERTMLSNGACKISPAAELYIYNPYIKELLLLKKEVLNTIRFNIDPNIFFDNLNLNEYFFYLMRKLKYWIFRQKIDFIKNVNKD